MDNKFLINEAKKAMENSYSPYSNFKVGAALLTDTGEVFTGCNIENASFGGTNCAERTALFKAISEGYKKFTKIAIISDSKNYTAPCGICRQVISEFSLDMEVIMANKNGEYTTKRLRELLPLAFTSEDL
ncbi:cytidine deaminase [Clostridium cylindrosporum]|uniref:Cytidine deaminase n=1 Tax=Clostridium cylindrosporum DSM 605 TaxID=1121307 RepID=A0A0J8G1M3_CLOCY|nr:cytidine deaminase [Clostridium cylindrosporum]KMT21656.1 cytidine deaminase Cdd [Clostridium cylindrosporum DSM 605]